MKFAPIHCCFAGKCGFIVNICGFVHVSTNAVTSVVCDSFQVTVSMCACFIMHHKDICPEDNIPLHEHLKKIKTIKTGH